MHGLARLRAGDAEPGVRDRVQPLVVRLGGQFLDLLAGVGEAQDENRFARPKVRQGAIVVAGALAEPMTAPVAAKSMICLASGGAPIVSPSANTPGAGCATPLKMRR